MPIYKRQRKQGSYYVVQVSIGGKRITRSLGPGGTKAEARQLEARLLSDKKARKLGQKPQRTIDEALAAYLDESARLKSYTELANHIKQIVPLVRGRALEEAPRVAEDIIAHGRAKEWSNATINRRLAALRRACVMAYKHWEWLDENVAERIRKAGPEEERHYYLTPAQVEEIAFLCRRKEVADLIRIAAYTGLRRSELLGLDPRGRVKDGMIHLGTDTKSGKPRMVPIHPRVEAAVHRLPFPWQPKMLDKWWAKARDAAGLPHIRLHDLRHSNASWLIANGADLITVRDLLGHTNVAVTDRYSHLADDRLKAAVDRMGGGRRKK